MDYYDLIKDAKLKGVPQEKIWQSISAMSEVIEIVRDEHPSEYMDMMREQHEILCGFHYNEQFAKHDVSKLRYTNRDGQKCTGGYWTKEQICEATKNYTFPSSVNEWDKYVAFNVFYADTCLALDDQSIVKAAVHFFFKDEDGPSDGSKIWRYMSAMCG